MKGGLKGQRHRRLVAASCCIWLLIAVALVSCQNELDVDRWRSLATQGDAAAQFDLGDRYFNGEGVPQDNGEAVRWFRLAAEQGHARAQASLGFMYGNGEGVPKDDGEAARWYRLAAEQGYAAAQYSFGDRYFNGEGVPQDDDEAARWFRLAAEQGYASAQSNLGVMYRNGRGVPQDDGEALRWYRLAADQGHAGAQYNLGLTYANGRGVPQDDDEAARWFRLAADQGHAGGQYTLGLMYDAGRGVPQDYVAAHKWANLAAAQGHENARQMRDNVADELTETSESPFQAAAEAVDVAALRMTDLSARAPRNARDVAQAGVDLRIAAHRLRQGSADIDSLQELLWNAREMAVAGKRTAAYRQQPFSSDPVDAINAAIDALSPATPGKRAAERAAVALGDRMREIEEQRRPEYEAALARFAAAAAAAERGDGAWAAALAAGETVLALATAIEAEMSAIATEMAALEATAPPEVAAIAAASRMDFEQAVAEFESVVVGLQDQLELMRALVAELEEFSQEAT